MGNAVEINSSCDDEDEDGNNSAAAASTSFVDDIILENGGKKNFSSTTANQNNFEETSPNRKRVRGLFTNSSRSPYARNRSSSKNHYDDAAVVVIDQSPFLLVDDQQQKWKPISIDKCAIAPRRRLIIGSRSITARNDRNSCTSKSTTTIDDFDPHQLPPSNNYSIDLINHRSSIDDHYRSSIDNGGVGGGPITKAVINRGLKARFKSFSAWLLNEPSKKTSFLSNSRSFPTGITFGDSLKRWRSLRSSFTLGTTTTSTSGGTITSWWKLRRGKGGATASQRSSLRGQSGGAGRTSRGASQTIETDEPSQISTTSLRSLADGRTPWPIPLSEAMFLREFPRRGVWNENSFRVIGTIAKGAFGQVYRVALKNDQSKVFAMKVQSKRDVIAQNAVQQMKDEVSIHRAFSDYPFIAQLQRTWQSRSKLYIVLQYISGYGDLYQLWRDEGPFNEDATKIWAAELATAIDYMHDKGVIYRDLKMENVMLDEDGHVQLVDFGLAKWLTYGQRTWTICGTLQYMAPEVLRGESYNHGVDWWSLGVLLHTLITGSYPYQPAGDSHVTVKIDHQYVPPASCSVEARNLLTKLLNKDPNRRLRSVSMYKNEPFFKGINFDDVKNKTLHPFDYIPRMRRCNTCNVVDEEIEGLEESDLAMFQEDYEALKNFDSIYGENG